MDTNQLYRNAARLIPAAAASTLITLAGCIPVPGPTPPSTKPDSQYFGGAKTASGDVYATGYLNIPVGVGNSYASSFVLRKFDAKQKLLWERQYPDSAQNGYLTALSTSLPTDNAGKFIRVAGDGSVYVAAKLQKVSNYGKAHSAVDYDVALMKYSASGNLSWIRYVDLLKKDFPLDLELDANGNVYLQGRTIKLTTPGVQEVVPSYDYYNDFVASFNGNGDLRWRLDFNGQGQNITGDMQFKNDGFYMTVVTGDDGCGNLYKVDFAGHIAPVSADPLAACPGHGTVVGDHVVFNPASAGEEKYMILALNNLGLIEKTITFHDIVSSHLHATDGFTAPQYELLDQQQPNSFFVFTIGAYEINGPDTPWVSIPQLIQMSSKGDVLSIVPIVNPDGTEATVYGDLELTQAASGDVIIGSYAEDPADLVGGNIYVVNYNSHAVTHYSFAPGSWLSSITGLEIGQQPLVVGSKFVNGIWTPSIKRFDQGQ